MKAETKSETGLKRGDMSVGFGCRKRGTKGHFKNVCAARARIVTDATDADAFIRNNEAAHPNFEFRVTLRVIHVEVNS